MFLKIIIAVFFLSMTIFAQLPPIETGVSHSLAKWRSANYSDVRYRLNITLEKGAPLMTGDIEIRVNLSEEGAKNDLFLDWRTTQFANDKDKPFADVVAVNDAAEILTSQSNEHIRIPKASLKTGENVIKINFASPIKTSGAAVTRYVDKEDNAEYIYSLFVPSDASTAFPVFDQPDLKAKFQLNVFMPIDWKVISNTNIDLQTTFTNGRGLNRGKDTVMTNANVVNFAETKPISTYVFAFAAGEFAEFTEKDGDQAFNELVKEGKSFMMSDETFVLTDDLNAKTGTHIFVRKSQAEKFKQHAAEVFQLNREGVKFLEDWFDYKFPFPKYDLVLLPEFPFGGMEHAGATFLREDRVIFPTEPTKNDYITRANVIFHEAAHQWFGDTVTMKWFDDLWLKEGFAEFMAYKTLAKVMPEYNAWKIFYERNKQAAYLTDVTRGTTPIYQEIPNLSAAKSAYGNIVYRKAPSFLRQAEFYLGEKEFQTAVRAFLKKHEFANAEWTDLVKEFRASSGQNLDNWADVWVKQKGVYVFNTWFTKGFWTLYDETGEPTNKEQAEKYSVFTVERHIFDLDLPSGQSRLGTTLETKFKILIVNRNGTKSVKDFQPHTIEKSPKQVIDHFFQLDEEPLYVFPNYQDYGYGIFLLDEKSRAYVLENIGAEKDDFLRSMMWGSLWDSVRFYELAPEDYVKLVIKNLSSELRLEPRNDAAKITPEGVTLNVETDESTIAALLNRVSTAMNYYLTDEQAEQFAPDIEKLLIDKMQNAPTLGQRITFYRSFVSLASTENARQVLKDILSGKMKIKELDLKTKDKFDIVTKLIILGDKDGLKLLAELEKSETGDAAKRYAYAAKAGIPTKENKLKYWKDFTENKEISESYIESAFNVWNTPKHADLTLPYLAKSLAELPNLKKNRKIFFVNGWLSSFIGGQKSKEALEVVNKFLADNSDLDKDLRLKVLENVDNLERSVKIREKFGK